MHFSCGFESGALRVFDIVNTCVCEEYNQFNLPILECAYSADSKLLVTVSKDGYVAVHNAKKQHQPIKMFDTDFPPEHVAIDFSSDSSRFGTVGSHGSCINVWDSNNFVLKNAVVTRGFLVKSFKFTQPHNRELTVLTTDCKVRFYSLSKPEGVFIRELANAHRGSINSLNYSANSAYFMSGGNDHILKMWDAEAQKTSPYYFQAFIGHTYAIKNAIFNPNDNRTAISIAGGYDGIFLWDFMGDLEPVQYTEEDLAS
jgi:WD40 repeat protein